MCFLGVFAGSSGGVYVFLVFACFFCGVAKEVHIFIRTANEVKQMSLTVNLIEL